MPFGTRSLWDTLRVLGNSSIGVNTNPYTFVGDPLEHQARQIIITNNTDVTLYFSIYTNGSTNDANIEILPSTQFVDDISTNRVEDGPLFLSKGDQLAVAYVAGSAPYGAPTLGQVSLAVMYAKGD